MGDGGAEGLSVIGEGGQAAISFPPDTDEKGSVVVASEFWSTGLTVVTHGFSYSVACGIFLDQGSNPNLLHWPVDYCVSSLENVCLGLLPFFDWMVFFCCCDCVV